MNVFELFVTLIPRIIFVLGVVNLITGVMILFTCRCIAGARIVGKLMAYPHYQRFFSYHCYIWWAFWVSVIVHAILAILLSGIPL